MNPRQQQLFDKFKKVKYGLTFRPILDVKGNPVAAKPDVIIEKEILRNYEDYSSIPGNKLMSWEEHFKVFVIS